MYYNRYLDLCWFIVKGAGWGGGGGVPNSVFNKLVLIRDSISEISP